MTPSMELSAGRTALLEMLAKHVPADANEAAMRDRIVAFVSAYATCFERSEKVGHITSSAWVVDREREHALLTHHAKLHRWLQLGGHCDGDSDVLRSAQREVHEESGLTELALLLDGRIYDVDAHEIPARGDEPTHVHYDIRFAFEADRNTPLQISSESKDLRWVRIAEIAELNTDASVLRLAAKTARLTTGASS